MPDTVGDLVVNIQGDYSALDTAIQEAASNAKSGAQTISSAFASASPQAQALDTAMQALMADGLEFESTVRLDAAALLSYGQSADQTMKALGGLDQVVENLTSDTEAAGKGAETAAGEFQDFNKSAASLTETLKQTGDSLTTIGKDLSAAFTVPLAAIGAALIKVGVDFDESSDTIRAKTGATGAALEQLNGIVSNLASNVPNKLGDITTAVTTLETRLGLTGPALEELSTQLLNLSRITGESIGPLADNAAKAFQRWNIATADQAAALDKLYYASTQTGTGVNQMLGMLRQFAPALQEVGFGFDQSTALIAKFEQAGLNTQRDITALQQALLKLGKAGVKDPVEGLQLIVDRIKAAGSAGEANAIGLKVFGKGAVDLVAAIRDGKLNLDGFVASMQNSSGAVNKAASDTLSFADKLKLLANRLETELRPAAESFLKLAEQLIDDLTPLVKAAGDAAKTFADLDPAFQKAAIGAGTLLFAIGPLTIGIGSFMGAVAKLIPILGSGAALEGLAGAETAAAEAATGLSGALAGIGFASLLAGVAVTVSNLNELREKWDDTVQNFKQKQIVDAINSGVTLSTLKEIGVSVDQVKASVSGLSIGVQEAGEKFDNFGIKVTVAGASTKDAAGAQDKHNASLKTGGQSADEMNAALNRLINGGHKAAILSVGELLAKQTLLDSEVKAAQAVFDRIKTLYDQGSASAQALSRATDQLAKAQKAARDGAQSYVDVEEDWTQAQAKAEEKARTMAIALANLTEQYNQGAIDNSLLARAIKETESAFSAAGITEDSFTQGTARYSVEIVSGTQKTQQFADSLGKVLGPISSAKSALNDTGGILPTFTSHAAAAAQAVDTLNTTTSQTGQDAYGAVSGINAMSGALQSLDEQAKAAGIDLMSFKSISEQLQSGGTGGGRGGKSEIASFGGFSGDPQSMLAQFRNLFGSLTPQPYVNGTYSPGQANFIGLEETALRKALADYYAGPGKYDPIIYDERGGSHPNYRLGNSGGGAPAQTNPLAGSVPTPGAPGHYQPAPGSGITIGLKDLGGSGSGSIGALNTAMSGLSDITGALTTDIGQAAGSTVDFSQSLSNLSTAIETISSVSTQAAADLTQAYAPLELINASPGVATSALAEPVIGSNGTIINSPSVSTVSNTTNQQTTGTINYNIQVTSPTTNQIAQDIITQLQRKGPRT